MMHGYGGYFIKAINCLKITRIVGKIKWHSLCMSNGKLQILVIQMSRNSELVPTYRYV